MPPPRLARPARHAHSRSPRPGDRPAWWCRRDLPHPGSRSAIDHAPRARCPTATARPRSIRPRPCSMCSSTNWPIRRKRLRIGTQQFRLPAGGAHRLRHGHTIGITQRQRPIRTQHTSDHPRASAGDAEPGPLLVDKVHHPNRPPRPEAVRSESINRQQRADHARAARRRRRRPGRCPGESRSRRRRQRSCQDRPTRPTGCPSGLRSGPDRGSAHSPANHSRIFRVGLESRRSGGSHR